MPSLALLQAERTHTHGIWVGGGGTLFPVLRAARSCGPSGTDGIRKRSSLFGGPPSDIAGKLKVGKRSRSIWPMAASAPSVMSPTLQTME